MLGKELEGSQLERRLVDKAKAGDGEAFEAVFEPYRIRLERYATRFLSNPTDGEDVAQETLISAWIALPQTSEELNVRSWLFKIATNTCIDIARHRSAIRMVPLENLFARLKDDTVDYSHPIIPELLSTPSAEESVVRIENEEEIRMLFYEVLESLRPIYRKAIVCRYFLSLGHKGIAEILGMRTPGVKTILYRAREDFRREIARKGVDIGFLLERA